MNPILKADDISLRYGEKVILDHLHLEVSKGEFVCVVGESGSGKTTLLKILAGLLSPTGGKVLFHDKLLQDPDEKLVAGEEEIKMVFQDYALKHSMTVFENLNYALLDYTDEYRERRLEELLDLCKLSEIKDQRVEQLSGGQKQRVAFSRAMANEPEIIMMDEPFSNLDPATTQTLLQETKSLSKQTNTTILLVTHDTRDAMEAADRIIILENGNIRQSGTPMEIYEKPINRKIANYFGYLNELTRKQLRDFFPNFESSAESFGIWGENIRISRDSQFVGMVKTVIFKGAYYVLEVDIKEVNVTIFDFRKQFKVGDAIGLSFDPEDVIEFDQ